MWGDIGSYPDRGKGAACRPPAREPLDPRPSVKMDDPAEVVR
jgi:hypothetical protein